VLNGGFASSIPPHLLITTGGTRNRSGRNEEDTGSLTNHRLIELVLFLARVFTAQERIDIIDIEKSLTRQGYSTVEINTAVSWFTDVLEDDLVGFTDGSFTSEDSFRIQGALERRLLTPDAFGFLLNLRSLGLINDIMYEGLLNHLLLLGIARADKGMIEDIVVSDMFGDNYDGDELRFELEDGTDLEENTGTIH